MCPRWSVKGLRGTFVNVNHGCPSFNGRSLDIKLLSPLNFGNRVNSFEPIPIPFRKKYFSIFSIIPPPSIIHFNSIN